MKKRDGSVRPWKNKRHHGVRIMQTRDKKNTTLMNNLVTTYKMMAIMLLNTIVVFAVLNGCIWGVSVIWKKVAGGFRQEKVTWGNPVTQKYQTDLTSLYPGYEQESIERLLWETWSRPYVYESFTQFKERPYHGNYVNVSEWGFRETDLDKGWPPDNSAFNIFVFGGSTMFGYGVADSETVSAYLEKYLNKRQGPAIVHVYNWGRGHYYSSQELILFLRLLSQGTIPNMAVFVDGLNEFYYNQDKPLFTAAFNDFINGAYERRVKESTKATLRLELSENSLIKKLPLYKLVAKLHAIILDHSEIETDNTKEKSQVLTGHRYDDKKIIQTVIERYLNNKRLIQAIGKEYNVKTVFVWQPVPTYKYDLNYHLVSSEGFGNHTYSKYGYPSFERYLALHPLKESFIWAANLQETAQEALYVDALHYSSEMSKLLAEYIGHELIDRGIYSGT